MEVIANPAGEDNSVASALGPTFINVIEKANSGAFSGTCLVNEEHPSFPCSPAIQKVLVQARQGGNTAYL